MNTNNLVRALPDQVTTAGTLAVPPTEPQRRDYFLWLLLGLLLLFTVRDPVGALRYPKLVDLPTIAALSGLMILTKGIETSHVLHVLAMRLIEQLHTERSLAVLLVLCAAGLATVLTNDIALFAIVPLTMALTKVARLPLGRLVAVEAMAVNVGSVLTPIGNPQNLFLWNVAKVSFFTFMHVMLPLTMLLLTVLLLFTIATFASKPVDLHTVIPEQRVDRRLLYTSLLLFAPFVITVDIGQPVYGLTFVIPIYLLAFRTILRSIDWTLLLVFVLMFIDLRLVSRLPLLQTGIQHLALGLPQHLYITAITLSQIISNVPATILLERHTADWQGLAYAVNIGGFGFILGSMANLIALRLAQDRSIWKTFHCYSIPYLLLVAAVVYLWLFGLRT